VRYLILSDIHANLDALEAVLADADGLQYDGVLVLGDLVGYGADPAAVMTRTFALTPTAIIRGNHDKVCAGLEAPASFNDMARASIEWTAGQLSDVERQRLADLPQGPLEVDEHVVICHGAPFDEDYYVFDADDAAQALESSTRQICLFGHTHVPAVYTHLTDPLVRTPDLAEDELSWPKEGPALINVGSVGQPRDGDPRAAYGLLDDALRTVRLRRVDYDVAAAQAKIVAAGLPELLALRLERGQ
jgi:diadenosine tetraphosphatase ApaH/serine/threonine PP2A family protein phosphatase